MSREYKPEAVEALHKSQCGRESGGVQFIFLRSMIVLMAGFVVLAAGSGYSPKW